MRKLIIAGFIFGLLACEAPPVRRYEMIAEHPEWTPETVKLIEQGFVDKGMTREQVKAAWGRPCYSCAGTVMDQSWEYQTQIVIFDAQGRVIKVTGK